MKHSISSYLEFVVLAVIVLIIAYFCIKVIDKFMRNHDGNGKPMPNYKIDFIAAIIGNLTAYLIIKLFFGKMFFHK